MPTLPDEYVINSPVYRNVLADVKIQENSSYLVYGYDAIISVIDEIDFIYTKLQALEQDKGIKFHESELDASPYLQELMLTTAKLCSGPHAHDTLSLYLHDSQLVMCQLHIAHSYREFYDHVSDKGTLLPETKTYLAVTA